jgi:hypothetical protein
MNLHAEVAHNEHADETELAVVVYEGEKRVAELVIGEKQSGDRCGWLMTPSNAEIDWLQLPRTDPAPRWERSLAELNDVGLLRRLHALRG